MATIGLNGLFLPLAFALFGGAFEVSEPVVLEHTPNFMNTATAECMRPTSAVFAHFQGGIQLKFAKQDDGVLYYDTGEKICAFGKNEEYEDMPSEYPTAAQFEAADSDTSNNPVGTWIDGSFDTKRENSILEIDGRSQIGLVLFGTASYTNLAGSISTGDFLGFDDTSGGSRIHSSFKGQQNSDCFLDIEQIGKFLIVLDSGGNDRCGGQNVSFTGIYVSRH